MTHRRVPSLCTPRAQMVRSAATQQGIAVSQAGDPSFAASGVRRRPVQEIFTEIHQGRHAPRRGTQPGRARLRRAPRARACRQPDTATHWADTTGHEFAESGLRRDANGNRVISVPVLTEPGRSLPATAHSIANHASDRYIYLSAWSLIFAESFEKWPKSLKCELAAKP